MGNNKRELQELYIRAASHCLNKASKFYADDLAAVREAAKKKSVAQLRESILRLAYEPSWREVRENCQFAGLAP